MKFELIQQQNDLTVLEAKLVVAKQEWQDEMEKNSKYKHMMELENAIKSHNDIIDSTKKDILDNMLANNLTKLDFENVTIKIKDTSKPSVEILDVKLLPKEYIRVKEEADKSSIMKMYKESGIVVSGANIICNPNYKLEIKAKK